MSKRAQVITLGKEWWKAGRPASDADTLVVVPKKPKLSDKYYSVKDIAKRFSVSADLIYDLIRSGRLRAEVLGRQFRVAHEELEAYLTKSRLKSG